MRIFDFFDKMELFNHLVEQGKTGSPQEFADRLNISRATLYNIIDELNAMGLDIAYSRTNYSFFYRTPASLDIHFRIKEVEHLSHNDAKAINGGFSPLKI
jgi:predicted DNA-binding transcriptional regulator YafY